VPRKKSGTYIAGMAAGALLVTGAIINSAVDIGMVAYNHGPEIVRKVEAIMRGDKPRDDKAPVVVSDLLPKTMYLHIRNQDGSVQSWPFSAKGLSTITGEISKPSTATKGVVSGYYRANTLVLSYASAATNRPGFGTLILRPIVPQQEDQPTIYAGAAIVHDCDCPGGVVANTGRILSGPALLSADPTPSSVHRATYLDRKVEELAAGIPYENTVRRANAAPASNGG